MESVRDARGGGLYKIDSNQISARSIPKAKRLYLHMVIWALVIRGHILLLR